MSEIIIMESWIDDEVESQVWHQIVGIHSENEIVQLQQTTGTEFGRLLLAGMIKHHEGAIVMAAKVISSENAEVAKLSNQIKHIQRDDIYLMQQLVSKLAK